MTVQAAGMQVHVAAVSVTVDGRLLRQRCGWCGALLLDYDLARVASTDGQPPSTWPAGGLVAVDGVAQWTVDLGEDGRLPPQSCTGLDPEITR